MSKKTKTKEDLEREFETIFNEYQGDQVVQTALARTKKIGEQIGTILTENQSLIAITK